jgi:hypothetical protein
MSQCAQVGGIHIPSAPLLHPRLRQVSLEGQRRRGNGIAELKMLPPVVKVYATSAPSTRCQDYCRRSSSTSRIDQTLTATAIANPPWIGAHPTHRTHVTAVLANEAIKSG